MNLNNFLPQLSDLDVNHAQATEETDRLAILKLMRDAGGAEAVNNKMKDALFDELMTACADAIKNARTGMGTR